MIVVKLQPLWMLLLRGSTRVYSGAHTVWVGDLWYRLYTLRRCLFYSYCTFTVLCGRVCKAQVSIAYRVHILLVNTSFGRAIKTKIPTGKGHCHLEEAQ